MPENTTRLSIEVAAENSANPRISAEECGEQGSTGAAIAGAQRPALACEPSPGPLTITISRDAGAGAVHITVTATVWRTTSG